MFDCLYSGEYDDRLKVKDDLYDNQDSESLENEASFRTSPTLVPRFFAGGRR
jgi:hypothetical protein